MNVLQVDKLTKSYGDKKVVDEISFQVNRGEIFGFLGPNGAGKSTTIEIIAGLKKADGGKVTVADFPSHPNTTSSIGVQLQSTDLYKELTVKETLLLFLNFHNRSHVLDEYIELTKLQQVLDTKVKHLSGGQRQRLSLSLALVADPEIVILDEPTVGLDPQSRRTLWGVIQSLKDRGKTVILTTHFMDEAEELCDRIAIIDHGRLIALDTPIGLLEKIPYGHTLTVTTEPQITESELKDLKYESIHFSDSDTIIHTAQFTETLSGLLQITEQNQMEVTSLKLKNAGLEELFLLLTGKELRD